MTKNNKRKFECKCGSTDFEIYWNVYSRGDTKCEDVELICKSCNFGTIFFREQMESK